MAAIHVSCTRSSAVAESATSERATTVAAISRAYASNPSALAWRGIGQGGFARAHVRRGLTLPSPRPLARFCEKSGNPLGERRTAPRSGLAGFKVFPIAPDDGRDFVRLHVDRRCTRPPPRSHFTGNRGESLLTRARGAPLGRPDDSLRRAALSARSRAACSSRRSRRAPARTSKCSRRAPGRSQSIARESTSRSKPCAAEVMKPAVLGVCRWNVPSAATGCFIFRIRCNGRAESAAPSTCRGSCRATAAPVDRHTFELGIERSSRSLASLITTGTLPARADSRNPVSVECNRNPSAAQNHVPAVKCAQRAGSRRPGCACCAPWSPCDALTNVICCRRGETIHPSFQSAAALELDVEHAGRERRNPRARTSARANPSGASSSIGTPRLDHTTVLGAPSETIVIVYVPSCEKCRRFRRRSSRAAAESHYRAQSRRQRRCAVDPGVTDGTTSSGDVSGDESLRARASPR